MEIGHSLTRAQVGIDSPLVTVEAANVVGLPQIVIVGMPATAVKESKDRVRAALMSAGVRLPGRKITVNLAPADLPKQGGRYDLAIAVAILVTLEVIPGDAARNIEVMGELSLDGSLRPVTGALPAAVAAQRASRRLIVPATNGTEASLAGSDNVFIARHLNDVIGHFNGEPLGPPDVAAVSPSNHGNARLSDIRGQVLAKRALMIAAAGAHNLLMVGPPGTGKTMLAGRLPGLLPAMTQDESLEVATVESISRFGFNPASFGTRPFRQPHHTASGVALTGGGQPPGPGEVSLAHNGVLFLDELPEYSRAVLEVLREPLESGEICISRANHQVRFPARFQLVAAMNPCPCGYAGDPQRQCECGIDAIERYRGRLSGPLVDRIDLHINVPPLPRGVLAEAHRPDHAEHANAVRCVKQAREAMLARAGKPNAYLDTRETEAHCNLPEADRRMLDDAMVRLGLSTRAWYKVIRVARTIADIDGNSCIARDHLNEALGYRQLDRRQMAPASS